MYIHIIIVIVHYYVTPMHPQKIRFYVVQILKCITTSSFQAGCTPSTTEANIQLFPFGSEYSSMANKVPPLKQKRGGYDQKVDIWAIGCLLFELLTGMGQRHAAVLGYMQTLRSQ